MFAHLWGDGRKSGEDDSAFLRYCWSDFRPRPDQSTDDYISDLKTAKDAAAPGDKKKASFIAFAEGEELRKHLRSREAFQLYAPTMWRKVDGDEWQR